VRRHQQCWTTARTGSILVAGESSLRQGMGCAEHVFLVGRILAEKGREGEAVSSRTGRSALSFNTVRYVSRHGDRAKHFAFSLAFDDRKGHLDV
jgi:hypothetical protein